MEVRPIKVAYGNDFYVAIPLYIRTWVQQQPCDTHIDAHDLTSIQAKVNGEAVSHTISEAGDVAIKFAAGKAVGTYTISVTATYNGSSIARRQFQAVQIVQYAGDEDVLTGSDSPYLLQQGIYYYNGGGEPTPIDPAELIRQNGVLIDENGELIEQNSVLLADILAAVEALAADQQEPAQQEVVYAVNYAALLLIENPSADALYITEDTGYLYKYRDGEFVRVEDGSQVDNTIYFTTSFTSMANSLKSYQTQGAYEIVRVYSSKIYLYSFVNTVTATRIQQKLVEDDANEVKTLYRVGTIKTSGTISWGSWVERTAVYREDVDAAKVAILDAITALYGGDTTATLAALKTAISNISIDTTALAQRTDVKDGNDTAIGMLKDATNGLPAIKSLASSAAADAAAAKTAAQGITGYALQGSDATATNTAILTEVKKVTAVDADILAGKRALATNISAKGVPTTEADAMTSMATKVLQIPQQINTRTSEFEQQVTPVPYMWNVFIVASDLMKNELPTYIPDYMSSGNYLQYRANNAFFVGEYYRGYDSLELTGADGYLTHDGCFYTLVNGVVTRTAPDGTVTTYEDTTIIHTWLNNPSDTYMNRWVAFFYLNNAYSFTCLNDAICPRRVALCGDCLLFSVNGNSRLTNLYVIGTLALLNTEGTASAWSKEQVLNNYAEHSSGNAYCFADSLSLVCDVEIISGGFLLSNSYYDYATFPKLKTVNAPLSSLTIYNNGGTYGGGIREILYLPALTEIATGVALITGDGYSKIAFKDIHLNELRVLHGIVAKGGISQCTYGGTIYLPKLEEIQGGCIYQLTHYGNFASGIKRIYAPLLRILSSQYAMFASNMTSSNIQLANLEDIEVGALENSCYCRCWNPTNVLADATKKAQLIDNIKNHILAKVSDATGGTQLVFTVSTNMYNAIASETITWQDQTMTLADAFLTKNWLLAGA